MDEPGKGMPLPAKRVYGWIVSGSEKISLAVFCLLSGPAETDLVFQN